MYTAYYMPGVPEGREDPSRSGFPTEKAAWKYIFQGMCRRCRQDRLLFLQLKRKGYTREIIESIEDDINCGRYWWRNWMSLGSEYPACSAEWWVIRTDELEASESFEDVFRAAGFTEILYKREDECGDTAGSDATKPATD